MARHFLSDVDLTTEEQQRVLDRAIEMKRSPQSFRGALTGRVLGMIFQKSSTRTRVSFEAGMVQLGGQAIFLSTRDIQLGRGEPVSDTSRVLARYVDAIMIRTYGHEEVLTLAEFSRVPVINGLDDLLHPCQALADLQTIREHKGSTKGVTLAYVGDGNNVSHSLMLAGALAGTHVRVICPKDYCPSSAIVTQARDIGAKTGSKIEVTHTLEAVSGADVVYTDVWASMGQEAEAEKRKAAFVGFQVDDKLMRTAHKDAIFLHCLPAHRGEEVSAEVIDGPRSRVFDQAENRLHAQKALLTFLLNG